MSRSTTVSKKLIADTEEAHIHQYRMPEPGERYLECEFCGEHAVFGREVTSIRQVDRYRSHYREFPEYRKQFRLAFLAAWQYYKRPGNYTWRLTLDRAIAAGAFPAEFGRKIDAGLNAAAEYWLEKVFADTHLAQPASSSERAQARKPQPGQEARQTPRNLDSYPGETA